MNRPTRTVPSPNDNGAASTQYADQIEPGRFEEMPQSNLPAERVVRSDTPRQDELATEAVVDEQVTLPKTGFAELAAAIAAVMAEIKPVDKGGWNDFHKYNYAKMQDLSRELTPLMGKHGIVIFQTEVNRTMFDDNKAIAVTYRFTIVHKSGQIWPEHPLQTGLSSCRNRGGFDDKAINKCHTSARKYFLLSLFQIPTADEDDNDSGEGNQDRPSAGQRPRRQVPSADGGFKPHSVPINGDVPKVWGERVVAFINKAKDETEIDAWWEANATAINKLKNHEEGPPVYAAIVDAMDARSAALKAPSDKIVSDDQIKGSDKAPAPTRQRNRAASTKKADEPKTPAMTDDERDFLEGIKGAYSGCEDMQSLEEEQAKLAAPQEGKVSEAVWNAAVTMYDENATRIMEQDK